MDKRVETVIRLIRNDLNRVPPMTKLARSVNLSTSRFYDLFTAELKVPPGRYLRALRMQVAKELLETTFLSVKEIVALSGFKDESHFVRNFKKLYGVSPSEHRGQVRKSSNQKKY